MTQQEFAARIVEMQGMLYRISRTILPQLADCEDAVQSAILKAWRYHTRLQDKNKMQPWVTKILVNECYALLRKRKREIPTETLPERAAPPDADPDLYRFFEGLPEKLRLVMALYYIEGYSTREISQILRLPAGTVKSRLARGREAMRQDEAFKEVKGLED